MNYAVNKVRSANDSLEYNKRSLAKKQQARCAVYDVWVCDKSGNLVKVKAF